MLVEKQVISDSKDDDKVLGWMTFGQIVDMYKETVSKIVSYPRPAWLLLMMIAMTMAMIIITMLTMTIITVIMMTTSMMTMTIMTTKM